MSCSGAMTAAAQRAQQALSSGQFDEVAKVLDAAEVESTNPDVLADWPHALHLLGLVYNGALEDARFLWKRIPAGAKQNNPELEAVFRLLQFSWNRHYTGIWTALQGYSWSALLQPLVEALTLRFRESMLDLVSRAYSTLPLAKLASLVGLKEAEALSLARDQDWEHDAASAMVRVKPRPAKPAALDGFATLEQLTEYISSLEH